MDYKGVKQMESQKNKFTGVFIPAAIYEMEEISWAEKILWCEICALAGNDVCYANNEYFAKKYKTTPEKISVKITKLKKLGLVKQVGFDGRKRYLKPCYEIIEKEPKDLDNEPVIIEKGKDSIPEKDKADLSEKVRQDYKKGKGSYNKYKYKEKIKEESISDFRTQEKFIPPTLEEVLEYAKERNSCAGTLGFKCSKKTAELFWSNYEANGWIISNECKTPIRDWKAKLRQWAIKEPFISAKNDDIIIPKQAIGDK